MGEEAIGLLVVTGNGKGGPLVVTDYGGEGAVDSNRLWGEEGGYWTVIRKRVEMVCSSSREAVVGCMAALGRHILASINQYSQTWLSIGMQVWRQGISQLSSFSPVTPAH